MFKRSEWGLSTKGKGERGKGKWYLSLLNP